MWEEWMATPQTRLFLETLKLVGQRLERDWKDAVFARPETINDQLMQDWRARSMALLDVSDMDRGKLTELMNEHDRD